MNTNILERISETEIIEWMIARFNQMKADGLPGLHYLDISIHTNGTIRPEPYQSIGAQGSGECVISHATTVEAHAELRKLVLGDPASKAREKKRQAKELLEEAESLEAIAKTL